MLARFPCIIFIPQNLSEQQNRLLLGTEAPVTMARQEPFFLLLFSPFFFALL